MKTDNNWWVCIRLWIVIVVVLAIIIWFLRKKKTESRYCPNNCCDCGPGGMFGPGWTMEKFKERSDELWRRAGELSGGLKGKDLELATQRAGGVIPYIQGRETAINRLESATNNLKDVMNIPGVHGLGSMMGEYIGIRVLDEDTKKKVLDFIEQKKKDMPMIPGHGKGYMNYPVKIEIGPMAVAQ